MTQSAPWFEDFILDSQNPLLRIPAHEAIRFSAHWTDRADGHTETECGGCERFTRLLLNAGGIVVDVETGEASLHPAILRVAQPVARPAVELQPGPPPAGDVLDAVDDQGRLRCACGCRALITDRSPSAYYASAGCQWRYLQLGAADPDDVYNRPDAAVEIEIELEAQRPRSMHDQLRPEYVISRNQASSGGYRRVLRGYDSARPALAWLQEIHAEMAERAEISNEPMDDRVRVVVPPPPHHRYSLVDYVRKCQACGAESSPWTVSGPTDSGQLVSILDQLSPANWSGPARSLVWQECGRCRERIPGRVYLGRVLNDAESGLVCHLQLSDVVSTTSTRLQHQPMGLVDQGESGDPVRAFLIHQSAATVAWRRMEAQLDAFAAGWRATNPDQLPVPAGQPYMIDVPPPPRWRGRRR